MTFWQVVGCAAIVGVLCLAIRSKVGGRVALLAWLVLTPIVALFVWFAMIDDELHDPGPFQGPSDFEVRP